MDAQSVEISPAKLLGTLEEHAPIDDVEADIFID